MSNKPTTAGGSGIYTPYRGPALDPEERWSFTASTGRVPTLPPVTLPGVSDESRTAVEKLSTLIGTLRANEAEQGEARAAVVAAEEARPGQLRQAAAGAKLPDDEAPALRARIYALEQEHESLRRAIAAETTAVGRALMDDAPLIAAEAEAVVLDRALAARAELSAVADRLATSEVEVAVRARRWASFPGPDFAAPKGQHPVSATVEEARASLAAALRSLDAVVAALVPDDVTVESEEERELAEAVAGE